MRSHGRRGINRAFLPIFARFAASKPSISRIPAGKPSSDAALSVPSRSPTCQTSTNMSDIPGRGLPRMPGRPSTHAGSPTARSPPLTPQASPVPAPVGLRERGGLRGLGRAYRLSTKAFRLSGVWRPFSSLPSRISAPGALGLRFSTALPKPLPPEVANSTIFLPEKS